MLLIHYIRNCICWNKFGKNKIMQTTKVNIFENIY